MKKFLCFLCVLLLGFSMSGVANALLYNRGGGLIYDSNQNITWLQDANYAQTSGYDADGRMTWDNAVAWADQLEYQGYSDWRLPDAHNQDGSGPGFGYNVTGSEMGYMFYNNLGGTQDSFCGADFVDGATGNTISFQNLQSDFYWSGTELGSDPSLAWDFNFSYSLQYVDYKDDFFYAWAVRPGDSSPVPEPTTMLLFGAGLIGLAGFGRKKFKK